MTGSPTSPKGPRSPKPQHGAVRGSFFICPHLRWMAKVMELAANRDSPSQQGGVLCLNGFQRYDCGGRTGKHATINTGAPVCRRSAPQVLNFVAKGAEHASGGSPGLPQLSIGSQRPQIPMGVSLPLLFAGKDRPAARRDAPPHHQIDLFGGADSELTHDSLLCRLRYRGVPMRTSAYPLQLGVAVTCCRPWWACCCNGSMDLVSKHMNQCPWKGLPAPRFLLWSLSSFLSSFS